MARGAPPVYDRAALKLTDDEKGALEAEGRKPHWRFKLDGRMVQWNDLIRGAQAIDTTGLSDPVLVREDGSYLYTLPSVIDDIDFAITHVIRGEDHVVNTAVQIEITEALGAKPPTYAHHSLLIGADGKGLSKRLGSLSIGSMREGGLEPMAVVSHAALLGTSDNIHPCADYAELVEGFALDKLSRAPGRFDEAELLHLNAKLLHHLPWDAVKDRLPGDSEDFWLAVRGNIEKLSDAGIWRNVVSGKVTPVVAPEDADFIAVAKGLLPPSPWDATTWKTWTEAVKAATGRKGKPLFMPLRLALTGLDHGPELAQLLPLIRDIRRSGAAAIDLCSVGAGRVDAYYEAGLSIWDLAAGRLVATEAGAKVGALAGDDTVPDVVLAAHPDLYGPLEELLRSLGAAEV
jgi:glutamyl-tRNA synthetase